MRTMTCKNHTGMKYYTKDAFTRNVHLIETDPQVAKERFQKEHPGRALPDWTEEEWSQMGAFFGWECPCPFGDLIYTDTETVVTT